MTADTEPSKGELQTISKAEVDLAYRAISGEVVPDFGDPEAMARSIADRIKDADSFEEAFASPEDRKLPAWSEKYMNVPVLVQNVRLNKSSFAGESLSAAYAVVDVVVRDTGETDIVSTGGFNVLHQLIRMVEKGWQANPVKMTAQTTAQGFETLWLVRA